jgi:hypothetical protein
MTTAFSIVKGAMQKLGVITKSETPSSDEADDGLVLLNDLISSWSTKSTIIMSRTLETFPLTGAASYTIGIGGAFNTAPPVQIVRAYVRNGTLDTELLQITQESYENITLKTQTGIPECFVYDNAYPLGTIKLYPIAQSGYTLYILTEKPLTQFSTLSTDVELPSGWRRALVSNLAIEMAPEYSQPVPPLLQQSAIESLGQIKRQIIKARSKNTINQIPKNIYTGWY